jgi:hypothetical protein
VLPQLYKMIKLLSHDEITGTGTAQFRAITSFPFCLMSIQGQFCSPRESSGNGPGFVAPFASQFMLFLPCTNHSAMAAMPLHYRCCS